MAKSLAKQIEEGVEKALSANVGRKRYIDVSRIPLICQSIVGIHQNLETINTKLDNKYVTKESFSPVRTIVYGMIGIILTSVIIGILSLVIKK